MSSVQSDCRAAKIKGLMLRTVFCVLMVCCGTTLVAQNKYSLGFFRSLPVGNYKSHSLEKGSFAKPGWGAVFEDRARIASWPKGFYVLVHLSYQQNQLDNTALQEGFTQELGYRTVIGESNYSPLVITLGPYFEIPLSVKTYLGVKTGIGFMFTNIDAYSITAFDAQNNEVFDETLSFNGSPNFSFLIGLQYGLKISNHIELGAFADFSGGREKVSGSLGNIRDIQSYFDLAYINTGLNVTVSF